MIGITSPGQVRTRRLEATYSVAFHVCEGLAFERMPFDVLKGSMNTTLED
jgi:hypothetical protein